MQSLAEALSALSTAAAQDDLPGMRAARTAICTLYPESEAAAEAHYRLGLDALFYGKDIDAAMAAFDRACASKHPAWAPAARTSLALCLLHLGRAQKGMFELRKVAFAKAATLHSVVALGLIESFCSQRNQPEEALRARRERILQLEKLVADTGLTPLNRAQLLMQLGLACKDAGDKKRATSALTEAKRMGPSVLTGPEMAMVTAALA